MADKQWVSYVGFDGGVNAVVDGELINDNELTYCMNLVYNQFGQLIPRVRLSMFYDETIVGDISFFIEYANKLFWTHSVRGFVEGANDISPLLFDMGVNWQNKLYLAGGKINSATAIKMLYGTTSGGVFTKKHETFAGLPKPASPTLTFNSAGSNLHASSSGYSYIVTFYREDTTMPYYVESVGSDIVTLTTTNDGKIDLSNIPLIPNIYVITGTGVTCGRKIYRIGVSDDLNNNTADFSLVATIPDNTTTTYSDDNPDSALGIAYDSDDNDRFAVGGYAQIYDMTIHQNRLFVVGASLQSNLTVQDVQNTISFSKYGLPEYFPKLNFIRIDPDDNDRIMRIVSFKNQLIIFKQKNIYVMTGTSEDSYNVELYVRDVGLQRVDGITASEYGIYFLAQDGIRLFNGSPETELVDKIGAAGGGVAFYTMAYKKPRVVMDYSQGYGNFAFFDENMKAWTTGKSSLMTSSYVRKIFSRKSDLKLYYGLSNGKIISEDRSSSEDFTIMMSTKAYSMNDIAQWKQFYRFEPIFTGIVIPSPVTTISVGTENNTYTYQPLLTGEQSKTNLPATIKGRLLGVTLQTTVMYWNNFVGFSVEYRGLGMQYQRELGM